MSSGEPNACWASCISSARCSAVIELQHPLRRGRPLGQRVEQLVDVLRVLGEEVAVLVHEVGEVLLGVLALRVLRQQLVEVGEHLVDRGAVLVGGVLERLLHAGEALVEQLAAEQVLDLLVVLAGLAALPVVVAELADRRRGARTAGCRAASRAGPGRPRPGRRREPAACARSSTARSSSSRISCRVPSRLCCWASSRRRSAIRRARSSRPRWSWPPRRRNSRIARSGE